MNKILNVVSILVEHNEDKALPAKITLLCDDGSSLDFSSYSTGGWAGFYTNNEPIADYGSPTANKRAFSMFAMHPAQIKILELAKECNKKHEYLAHMSFREIGDKVGLKHAQQVKHHIEQLIKKGLLKTTKIKENT